MALPDLSQVAGFQWDAGNDRKSEKHGVSMREAEEIFADTQLMFAEDSQHSTTEARYDALGRTFQGRLLQVAFTLRQSGTLIRVISARLMSRKERAIYAQVWP